MFCSLLGQNTESWGLSYQAHFHHGGQIWQYGGMFGQGSLLGIHLDCWNGTLSFYKNRRPLGENNVAFIMENSVECKMKKEPYRQQTLFGL